MQINHEILDKVQITTLICLSERLDIEKEDITYEDFVKELSNDNIYLFGHALMDIHEYLDLKVEYVPLSEYDIFDTVEDVIKYFYARLSE